MKKKRRRSSKRSADDVIWAIVLGALALGGIVLCARYQGNLHGAGMRLALIAGAICIGAGAGVLVDRLTARHRSGRSGGANRKARRHIRTVTFAITGIIVASCVVAGYMAHQLWIIFTAAGAVLFATWIWYFVENYRLSRGTGPGRPRDQKD